MATLLALLLLLTVPLTAFTANVYYVTPDDAAGHEQLCPPHQICHNLSYYISQPGHYFTNDTTMIFLKGQHNLHNLGLIQVKNVHNLTLKGQGEWPIAGAEETVMQSTVIINCTRGRGGFIFDTGYNINIEGITITNCGDPSNGVFLFASIGNLYFLKNSIQFMTGYGFMTSNCISVKITNCSFYHSVACTLSGGGAVISYARYLHRNVSNYTMDLSYSNFTECCSLQQGGGIGLVTYPHSNVPVKIMFYNLIVSRSKAKIGGCLSTKLQGSGNISLEILNSFFSHCSAKKTAGGVSLQAFVTASLIIENTNFVENGIMAGERTDYFMSELDIICQNQTKILFSLLDSNILHTTPSNSVVYISYCQQVTVNNSQIKMANQHYSGFANDHLNILIINNSCFAGCYKLPSVLLIMSEQSNNVKVSNTTFFNNTSGQSVITFYRSTIIVVNSRISDNNMTGITAIKGHLEFRGHNVIQNNRYTEGAGITLVLPGVIAVTDQLYLLNNTAENRGGAILVIPLPKFFKLHLLNSFKSCSFTFYHNASITFSGNTAKKGGDNLYGATLIDCYFIADISVISATHVGLANETSYYFYSPLMKYFQINNTSRLSSISSDPIMVCFCNTSSNLPDCSDRTPRHIQTYPGLEINTTIATVGYYGGTSPGVVQVSAQHAKLVHFYGQNETINCFQIHILLKKETYLTALVGIKVESGLSNWDLNLTVDILECPVGFVEAVDKISGQHQCHCIPLLVDSQVQCNVSLDPYKFLRSGKSWFAYINTTQTCITGTTNCPFHYCNQSNVSFDIMAPDRQCLGNRTGILCGQCHSHLSIMLGSNRCGTCSNWYLFLLPVFALAGIVLVAVLMFLNLSISVGTINGLLLYANMVKLNEAFFFPNGSIPVVSQFISWLNLDLGIEMCLFDGLDGYWNTWLQFVFPAYLFLLMGGIIVGCRYFVWLCRLCGSHAVPALATLFLMSYTKILLTVANGLSMSQLPCNDSKLTVWSVDGNIEYGSGKHLILVLVSCGVLIIGLAYPVLVLFAPLLERYSHKCIPQQRWNLVTKLKPLLDAYGGPYKDNCRFWTGVTLMLRLILTVIFSFTLGRFVFFNAYIIITVIVGILTFWSFTNGVYKSVYLSALEMFYLLNIFFLSIISLANFYLDIRFQIAIIVSVILSFIVFLGTVVMHVKLNFDLKKIKRRLGFKNRPEYIAVPQVTADEVDEGENPPRSVSPPSMVYGSSRGEHQFVLEFSLDEEDEGSLSPVLLKREPLLFDTNLNF